MGALEGKVALVTGGASGIGLATARILHGEGASVVIVDLQQEKATDVADELDGIGIGADVGRSDSWPAIVEAAMSLGGLHIAHLNAGTAIGVRDLAALTDSDYRRIMSVNLDGVVFGIRSVLPAIAASGGGSIVVTASLAGLIAFDGDPIYTATKHAVIALVRSLAPTLHEQGITINAVCPSLVDTPLIDGQVREVLVGSGFPLLSPDEVAGAVYGCIIGEATGEAIVVQTGMAPSPHRFARVQAPAANPG